MAPGNEDDWSDSDDDAMSEVETSVLLGVPDGSIDDTADIQDAAVSRIGGLPVRDIFLCTIRLAHDMYFDSILIEGVPARARTRGFFFELQDMRRADGAARADVVPCGRQPAR